MDVINCLMLVFFSVYCSDTYRKHESFFFLLALSIKGILLTEIICWSSFIQYIELKYRESYLI